MDDEQQLEPKISTAEIVLIGAFYGILDVIDIIPIAGDITDIIAAPMFLYYSSKGISGIPFLVSEILDAIPLTQEFPSRTIGWIVTVVIDRNPKLEAQLQTAAAVAGAVEGAGGLAGGGEALEGAAAAEGAGGEALALEEAGATEGQIAEQGFAGEAELEAEQATGEFGPTGEAEGAEEGGANAKPSEESTERGAEGESRSERRRRANEEGSDSGGPSDENRDEEMAEEAEKEQKEEDIKERYEDLVTPDAMQDPVKVAKRQELGSDVQIAPRQREPDPRENDDTRWSSDRFAREQARLQKARDTKSAFDKLKSPSEATEDDVSEAA